jgi:hypothetical protein
MRIDAECRAETEQGRQRQMFLRGLLNPPSAR